MHKPIGRVHHEVAKEPTEFISTGSTDAGAVAFLNDIFRRAARESISDLHFEDTDTECIIRFRRNGELVEVARQSAQMSREFDKQFRVKCKKSLVERLTPQDGKFRFDVDGRFVDVRVSILPIGVGQSIVCRLLDQQATLMTLDELQMPEIIRSTIRTVVSQPQGLFLVTGPTGSGKTTTLYGILQHLNTPKVKIITAEDPIEYRISGIVQAQTNERLTFASALKSMLRQDPDIILVGEIRDSETARIATQAALTGHIVLSTLHTNSAAVSLTRMLDLGVDQNALAASVGGFMAQRLVRCLCPHCKVETPVTQYAIGQMKSQNLTDDEIASVDILYEPDRNGCEHCTKGWAGRTPVFELIIPTPEARQAIEEGNLKSLIRAAEGQQQYQTLAQHAMRMALDGSTSLNEVMSVTGSGFFIE
ncbi:GspE/PulE family protein [Diaphorobacter sp. J5-51]|uniref:GspE/PulE family protein n=1 Tax=Diaphorobacter sp. J5-51 TaxID=680496 RepID=UPI00064326E5|nr:GspE/PulE family protein [Diaphorobacter sp. J5-51]